MTMNDKLLTVKEVEGILQVHENTVYRYIQEGKLKALKLPGGDYRIPYSAIEDLLKPNKAV